jgi:hypothetical protein
LQPGLGRAWQVRRANTERLRAAPIAKDLDAARQTLLAMLHGALANSGVQRRSRAHAST